MPFPARFKSLIESTVADVPCPDYAWASYSVCATTDDSCGWAGWVLEAAYRLSAVRQPTGTGDTLLPTSFEHCPECGKPLFRTSVSIRLVPSASQEPVHGKPGVAYEVAPTAYEP